MILALAEALAYDLLKLGASRLNDKLRGDEQQQKLKQIAEKTFNEALLDVKRRDENTVELELKNLLVDETSRNFIIDFALADTIPSITDFDRIGASAISRSTLDVLRRFIPLFANELIESAKESNSPLYNRISLDRLTRVYEVTNAISDDIGEFKAMVKFVVEHLSESVHALQAEHMNPVFISYARKDGREIASRLRQELIDIGFNIWQDVVAMEGGDSWWQQIKDAIEDCQIMILVLTNGALESPVVHDEWSHARTVGTHIMPVTLDKDIFDKAPRWMTKVDVFILNPDHPDYNMAQIRFLKQLNNPPERKYRPFTAPNVPDHFVERPNEMSAMMEHILDETQENPVAITTAFQGSGGFGKTTLAIALCHEERTRVAFDDGILWIEFRENMTQKDLLTLINQQIKWLSPQDSIYNVLNDASARFRDLLKDRDMLIVLDDVWIESHLQYCVHPGITYILTTRVQPVAGGVKAKRIFVNDMQKGEATDLLTKWLPESPTHSELELLEDLALRLGEWPLLLKLVAVELNNLIDSGRTIIEAVGHVVVRLEDRGISYLDRENADERNLSIGLSINASISHLKNEDADRFYELAIFPEDNNIPFEAIEKLWGATAEYRQTDTEDALETMNRLSLFVRYDSRNKFIRLHDVIRKYLLDKQQDNLSQLQKCFIESLGNLTELRSVYIWQNIAYHLKQADQMDKLYEYLLDFKYLQKKLKYSSIFALIEDFDVYLESIIINSESVPEDANLILPIRLIRSAIDLSAHMVGKDEDLLPEYIVKHLAGYALNFHVIRRLFSSIDKYMFLPISQTFQPAGGALIRILQGQNDNFSHLALIDDFVISLSNGSFLGVWNWKAGEYLHSLEGHTDDINAIKISGQFVITTSHDQTIKVWNWQTGELERTLIGHTDSVYAVEVVGDFAISTSADRTIRTWNWQTGEALQTMKGHKSTVVDIAIIDEYAMSASWDRTLIVWKWKSGELIRVLKGHKKGINTVQIIGDLAISSSDDRTVRVWNWSNGKLLRTVDGCIEVNQTMTLSDDFLVVSQPEHILHVWHWKDGTLVCILRGHTNHVNAIAIADNLTLSVSDDKTIYIWDLDTGENVRILEGHKAEVTSLGLSNEFAVSGSKDSTIRVWNWHPKSAHINLAISLPEKHQGPIITIAVSGDYAVTASDDKTLRVWDWNNGRQLQILEGHKDSISCMMVANNIAISGSLDRTLFVWDCKTGDIINTFDHHKLPIREVRMSDDLVISTAGNQDINVWNWKTGGFLHSMDLYTDSEQKIAIGSKFLVLVENLSTVSIWNWINNTHLRSIQVDRPVESVKVYHNFVILEFADNTLKIWKWLENEISPILKGHTQSVNSTVISDKYVVSASDDRTICVWDWTKGELLQALDKHKDAVIKVSMVGDFVISSSLDMTLILWNWKLGQYICSFVDSDQNYDVNSNPIEFAVTSNLERIILGVDDGTVHFLKPNTSLESLLHNG